VRSAIDDESIQSDVEAHQRVHERNTHDAGSAAVDPLGAGPVQATQQGQDAEANQRRCCGDCKGGEDMSALAFHRRKLHGSIRTVCA